MPARRHRVAAVVYDNLCVFEFGILVEMFGLPRPELPVEWYRFGLCSLDPGPLAATAGVRIEARHGLSGLRTADTIAIPGWRDVDEIPPAPLLRALRRAHDRGARIVALCSGAFVLAAAGLLDGRRATTHWRYAEAFRSRYPLVRFESNVLYVDEDRVLTSAGSAAGIDLCLHVVRRDYGAEIANLVARRLVVPPHRDGGQAQYVPEPVSMRAPGGLARVQEWALARLDRPLALEDLAREGNMSVRTLARRFEQETGKHAAPLAHPPAPPRRPAKTGNDERRHRPGRPRRRLRQRHDPAPPLPPHVRHDAYRLSATLLGPARIVGVQGTSTVSDRVSVLPP